MTANNAPGFPVCRKIFGSTLQRTDNLEFKTYRDVFYLPFSSEIFFDKYSDWGLYDADGFLIPQAAYRRDGTLVGQQERIDPSRFHFDYDQSDGLTYGGPIIPHYGHFLLSSIARTWNKPPGCKMVFHSDPPLFEHAMPYVVELLRAMKLNPSNAKSFNRPTRFAEILVPAPCFEEQGFAHPVFTESGADIGIGLTANSTAPVLEEDVDVFLSKSAVTYGITNFINESEFENQLRDAGFVIVHPQNLSVYEQVDVFRKARTIVGFEGSGFHTQVLLPHSKAHRLVLSPAGFLNSNFSLLDKIWQQEATYADVSGFVEVSDQASTFAKTYSIRHVSALVRGIDDWRRSINTISQVTESLHVQRHADNLENLCGEDYRSLLSKIRRNILPRTYFEIGTLQGTTLKLSDCASLAVDPRFQITQDVIGTKPICAFYQTGSDEFFANNNPSNILGAAIDFAFLDGMHRCEFLLRDFLNTERYCKPESVIVLHDCLPVELPMASRDQNSIPAEDPQRAGWWTGDVWKTALLLKEHRHDLSIFTVDAQPTGLVVITNLSPGNDAWHDEYDRLLPIMHQLTCSLREAHMRLRVQPTENLLPALTEARREAAAKTGQITRRE